MSSVATKMVNTEKRARIVELAKDGYTYDSIAKDVGLNSRQAVAYHLKQWFEETRPDPEATAELRQMQWARLEDLIAALRPRVVGPLMGMFGPVKVDGEFVIVPQPAIIDRLLKVYERQAKLMGLDLQPGIQVGVMTAEGVAAYFGWDPPAAVIEGVAVEITSGEETEA